LMYSLCWARTDSSSSSEASSVGVDRGREREKEMKGDEREGGRKGGREGGKEGERQSQHHPPRRGRKKSERERGRTDKGASSKRLGNGEPLLSVPSLKNHLGRLLEKGSVEELVIDREPDLDLEADHLVAAPRRTTVAEGLKRAKGEGRVAWVERREVEADGRDERGACVGERRWS
jgi:hypothetical protein